ncbi:MAG: mechanosensitive ion channel family protein [Desulfobacterales bacterium]|nr:mechanosensitive ion channel family protein [Desulfobacterales bacterium]
MKHTGSLFKNPSRPADACVRLLFIFFFLVFACPLPAVCAENGAETGIAGQEAVGSPDLYKTLTQSFEQAVKVEQQELEKISDRLEYARYEQEQLDRRLARLQLMISTHSNLLLVPATDIQSLEQARTRQTVAVGALKEQIKKLQEKIEELDRLRAEAEEQIGFYTRQIKDIRSYPSDMPNRKELTSKFSTLIDILETKQDKIEHLRQIYTSRLERFNHFLSELTPLSEQINQRIAEQKQSRIFNYTTTPVIRLYQGELQTNLQEFREKTRRLFAHTAWQKPDVVTWKQYGNYLAVFAFLLAVLEVVLYGLGRYCLRWMQQSLDHGKSWQYLLVKLIQKSLPLAGAIAFFYFYPIRPIYQITPFFSLIPLIIRTLGLVLVIRWGVIFLRVYAAWTEDPLFHRLYLPLRKLLLGILVYGIGYFYISRVICYNCISLVVWRLIFEFFLLGWGIYFLGLFLREAQHSSSFGDSWKKAAIPVIGCMVIVPGLVAELAGFGGFAAHWYNGAAKSIVVVFWGFIVLRALREADVPAHLERSEDIDVDDEDLAGQQPYPVRWLLVRLLRLGCLAGGFYALLLVWGTPRAILAEIFYAVNYKVNVGDFQLSLMGFVYAVIVLLVIHTVAVITKELLRSRILRDSEMETGLKDSIIRITGYVLWGIGVLIALRVMGVSGTALTVVFGALGIGIGFGLQNIFNNFLSGIILLFERPIQVGDVIEIGGIWGTVREINVRSTQVRTFDNADLIIPNADFISQSLTNWSFRDARVRRTVQVGVAHGSDIELVRRLLIEVAYQHPRILRRPHPEVLFSDFGESALIFKLRFWAHIDWFLIVETDVRFDIDKVFRENGITIPYPQRDLHFKSEPNIAVSGGTQEQET